MRKSCFRALLSLCALMAAFPAIAQPPAGGQPPAGTQQPAPEESSLVLRLSAREVVLDVVARDHHNNPVTDLAGSDFEVVEMPRHGAKMPKRVLSMRVIDPHKDASRAGATDNGFRISTGAICALNATVHYELAISASPEPGFHDVMVKTTRPQVTLSFRHRYYVGAMPDLSAKARGKKAGSENMVLGEAACFHSFTPPTLAITAHPVVMPGNTSTRYVVRIPADSLATIGLAPDHSRVQLDFGMCTFDATGAFGQFLHSSVDRELTPPEVEKAQARGLTNVLEIPGAQPPYLARLVVRDRETGNLGIVDVARPVSMSEQEDKTKALPRPNGSIRSFGVVTPHENTFCGDVYELSSGASALPDFWNIDPVGSIYTDALYVLEQDITSAEGIPGVTRNNTWFGVDYYGDFWISKAGEYTFELQSDDGSRLEIDNQRLIDLDGVHAALVKSARVTLAEGRHTVHVPYFQGPPTSLALMLRVKPPGEGMRPFNLREFAAPANAH